MVETHGDVCLVGQPIFSLVNYVVDVLILLDLTFAGAHLRPLLALLRIDLASQPRMICEQLDRVNA